jgi:iron complex transport system permease protein
MVASKVDEKGTRTHWGRTIIGSLAALAISIPLALFIGGEWIPPIEVLKAFGEVFDLAQPSQEGYGTIVLEIRLPRILMGALVGAGLAISGAVMQGLFRNPMADPYIIGTSSGSALGAAIAMSILPLSGLRPILAFLGAILSTFIVYRLARGDRTPMTDLLLVGVAVSLFLSAILSFLMYQMGRDVHGIVFWLMGGLEMPMERVYMTLFPIVIGAIGIYSFSRDLNAMLFGEESAHGLGVDTENVKVSLLILASLVTASSVAFAGTIGFVGLIIPHMTRILVGPDHRILIPSSALTGAIFLIWVDALARLVEVPVGVLTAFCGAPFFIYLLKRGRYGFGS